MKYLLLVSCTVICFLSCKKEEPYNPDANISYYKYFSLSCTGDTVFYFWIPNAFTPNGDGVNDIYMPKGVGVDCSAYSFKVFSRYGNLMFSTTNFSKGWEGKANGGADLCQEGVYQATYEFKDIFGESHSYSHHLTLIK